uniref:Sushi, von Willebrand factor type A, EGF and pentraxin domain containing 1 n=1 Tax=Dicentrarchus labrax TaxID=13489 RepID=A0A8C4ECW7_DICLA
MFCQRYSLTPSWTNCLLVLCILNVWTTAWTAAQQSQPKLQSRRSRQMPTLTSSSSAGNLSESTESKVERLGQAFKRNVRELREKSSCLDLVFLVDESSSVGANNFLSELRFVRKMLSDFPVAPEDTRVALVTFSSKTHVVTRVDHISAPKSHQHKCSLFNQEIPAINYRGGGTYTKGAFQRAAQILRHSRSNATKVIFLITDGYSNGGDPRPVAAALRERGVEIFTLGIWQGNIRELHDMASQPKDQHCYLVHNFAEFEALARRALHEDLPTGSYIQEDLLRCSSLCEAGKDCCDLMASCKCGTHTGQYDCICEKGYYGKGLQHECTACPPGTYKPEGTPGGLSTCLSCPDLQHTSQPGSTSLSDCVCKPGYQPIGMTCQVVYCPALSPPENGFFIQNVCNNHFEAACGVRCQPDFDLQGTSIRLCQADGTWSGTPASCRVRSCQPLSRPQHGFLRCSDGGASHRAECQVGCERGYRLEGDSRLACQANSQWSGPQPRCVEVRCPPIVTLKNILLSPPACGKRTVAAGFACLLTCRQGYSLQGNRKAVCLGSGNWTANVHKAICTDAEPPWMQCPGNIVAETDERRGTANVSWNVPTATDNSKEEVSVQVKPVYTPPQLFPIGKETITYIATDRSGNQANCSFTVTVIDTEPPVIDRCRSPPTVQATDTETAVVWEVPQFSDNSGGRLTVTSSHSSGSKFPVGETLVQYTATDAAGNSRTCNLTITVQGTTCDQPYVPVNGEFICSEEEDGVNCTLHCKDGYSFTQDAVHSYFCAYNGMWEPPYSPDRPDCSVNRVANNGFKPFEMLFKASRCDDVDLVKSFTGEFNTKLGGMVSSDDVTCKLEVLSQGHCLEYNYDYENGFSIAPGGWSNSWGPQGAQDYAYFESGFATGSRQLARQQQDSTMQPLQRSKRHRKITGPTRDQKIQIFFNITASIPLPLSRNDSIEVANQKRLLRTLEQLTNRLKRTLARQPLSSFHVSSEMIVADPKSLESKKAFLSCRPGSVLKGRMCVQCPVGTYFSLEHNECASCWLGSYQDQEGQLECKSCPEGTSTAYLHSRSVAECKGQCKPGSHSLNGLEICESCPLGHFQPAFGARECLVCPDETSTVTRGAVDETECGVPCSAGHFSRTGLVPCYPCPRDYYQPEHGRSYCLSCPFYGTTTVTGATTIQHCSSFGSSFLPKEESVTAAPEVEVSEDYQASSQVFHECFLNPCQNKGTCEEVGAGYVCTCMPGFTGFLCEAEVNECISFPCLNEGVCVDEVNKLLLWKCSHFPSRLSTGSRCELEINECLSNPCLNGGVCEDLTGGYTCNCAVGFSGDSCEVNIDECYSCDPNPCINGASCLDGLGSFTCRCLPGFNGTRCETEMSSAFNLDFEVSGIHGYVMMDGVMPALTEITCTFWMRSSDTTNYGTPISYAVEGSDNAFLLIDYNGWVLYVNGKERVTDCPAVNTGLWYHIGVSWRSWDGDWKIYINGRPSDGGKGLSVGTTIPGGGALVLGQDQDKRGEGFNPVESFVGSVSQLNIWDRVLTPQQIKVLASSCPSSHVAHRGNVLAWPDFLTGVVGRVKVNLNSIFCADCPKLENAVPHLHASTVEVSPGAQVQLSCDPGFYLLGEPVLQCQNKGEWSHPLPSCELTCGDPPPAVNANYNLDTNTYQSTVTYTCSTQLLCYFVTKEIYFINPHRESLLHWKLHACLKCWCINHYTLIGSETRECLPSGQWSDSSAQCVPRSCGPPPAIDHAEPYESHQLFGDTANYYCTDGYTAGNNSKMVCNAQGVWAPPDGMEAPRCIANFCLRPPELPHAILDSVNKPKYASNTEVSYKCEEGFMLNTTATLRCLMGGEWEPSPYDIGCVPVRCSKPESIDRGYVMGSNYSFGSVVAYGCNNGFLIRGEKRRTCKANGEWGGVLPTCVPVSCTQPPFLKNGYIQSRGRYTFNSKVIYGCNAGYRMDGRPERVCQANRQWSNNDPPTCVLLTCDPPPNIVHGRYRGSDFQVGRKVQYVCDEGYELVGDATWTCLKYGRWDKTRTPRCSPVQCPEPPLEENHLVLKGLDSESGTVELSCEDGYVLEGAQILRCTASQEWNDTFPVCKQVFCGALPEVSFGGPSSSSPPFPFGSMVSYTCMDGFTLRKEGSVSCLASGQWSNPYPECIPVECPQPVEVTNGIVDVQGLMYLSKALYSCRTGYNLVGNSTVLCGEKGLWIGGVPSCRPIECSIPKQIVNGKVVYTKLQFGHTATYSCRRGYRLQGPETVKCLASGEWDIEPPACVQVSCTPPQPIDNGFVEGQDHSFGVTIFYSCFPGFQLVGQDHLTCEEFGWSSSVPVCVPSDCGLPPHIDFGDYVKVTQLGGGSDTASKDTGKLSSPMDLSFLHGTLIEYRCHKGYDLTSPTRLVCQEDGGWNGTAPSCVPAECETPPSPMHGWVNVTDTSLGSMVKYTCEEGYKLEGEPVRQCVSGRLWTNDAPVCRPISCGDPGAIANGTAHGGAFVYPEVLRYECSPGFVLKGSDAITCQVDGKWTGQKPWCEPVFCGPPKVPSDITFKGEEYSYSKEIELSCQPGFVLQGKSISVCQADGTWSHESPTCVPAHCGKPSPIPNGHVLGSEFGFNGKVKYECEEGYTLNGDPTLICQSDGLWDKPVPRCDIISCDPPEDISHGFLNGSSFNYDDVVEYVCFDGYEVVGDPILRCSVQGLWVGTVPQCRPCACNLPAVRFGVVIGRDRACGDQVNFQCDDGYKLLGPSQAVCEKGGVWSPGVPMCGRGRCSAAPPTVPNAVQQGGSATFSDTVIYRCRPGYQPKGYPHLSCGRDGRWGEPRISCEPVSCGKPPAVANAQVSESTFSFLLSLFSYNSLLLCRCEDGYKLATKTSSLSCQRDGTWSKHSIRCSPTPCQLPTNFSIPHVLITGKELTPVGGTITLSCPPGLYLQGSAIAECQLGGIWAPSISSVSCELVVCEKPPPLLHGITEGDSYNYGDFVMYSCLPGFGMKVLLIRPMAKGCDSPKQIPHGKVQEHNLNTGRALEFLCDKGYNLVGDRLVVCMGGNTWSSTFPTCQSRSCPAPPGWREGGRGNGSQQEFHVGRSVRVTCPKGQQVKGSGTITCRPDQTWSPISSVCERVSCGPPLHVANGVVRGAVFQFGDVAVYSCFGGYAMEGVGRSRCLENGTWTPPPTCRAVCWLHCQNGGVCQRPNTCSCPEGWMGRLCEEPICILPCLNGGRCVAPYQCECPSGWTGTRCHSAVCSSPCLNGGRCIRPNRCHCSPGWSGHDCSR